MFVFDEDFKNPRTYQASVAYERQFAEDFTALVQYNYAAGRNITRFLNRTTPSSARPGRAGWLPPASTGSASPHHRHLHRAQQLQRPHLRAHQALVQELPVPAQLLAVLGQVRRRQRARPLQLRVRQDHGPRGRVRLLRPRPAASLQRVPALAGAGQGQRELPLLVPLGPAAVLLRPGGGLVLHHRHDALPGALRGRPLRSQSARRLGRAAQHRPQGQHLLGARPAHLPRVQARQAGRPSSRSSEIFNLFNCTNLLVPQTTNLIFNFDGTIRAGLGDPRQCSSACASSGRSRPPSQARARRPALSSPPQALLATNQQGFLFFRVCLSALPRLSPVVPMPDLPNPRSGAGRAPSSPMVLAASSASSPSATAPPKAWTTPTAGAATAAGPTAWPSGSPASRAACSTPTSPCAAARRARSGTSSSNGAGDAPRPRPGRRGHQRPPAPALRRGGGRRRPGAMQGALVHPGAMVLTFTLPDLRPSCRWRARSAADPTPSPAP